MYARPGGHRQEAPENNPLWGEAYDRDSAIFVRRVPVGLDSVDFVITVVGALIVTHVIEYKVLELGAEVGGVANRRCLKVSLGLLRDVPDVAAIALLSYRITDVAN